MNQDIPLASTNTHAWCTHTDTYTKGYNKEKFQDWWFEQDRDYFIHSLRPLSSEITSQPSLTFLSGRTLTQYICIIWVRRILHTTKSKWEHHLETAGTCEAHLRIYCHSAVLYFLQDVTLRNVHSLNTRQYLRTALLQLDIVYLATKQVKTNKIPPQKNLRRLFRQNILRSRKNTDNATTLNGCKVIQPGLSKLTRWHREFLSTALIFWRAFATVPSENGWNGGFRLLKKMFR